MYVYEWFRDHNITSEYYSPTTIMNMDKYMIKKKKTWFLRNINNDII